MYCHIMEYSKLVRTVKARGGLYQQLKAGDIVMIMFYPPYNDTCRVCYDNEVYTIPKLAFDAETQAKCERAVNEANRNKYERYHDVPPFPDRITKDREKWQREIEAAKIAPTA